MQAFIKILLVLLVVQVSAGAQINIYGKVLDSRNDKPLSGASVYFNNTSFGTSTDTAGRFSFTALDLPNTEMVISFIGYELISYKINVADNGKHFVFKLQPRQQNLKEVLVISAATRKKWLNMFRDNFLGLTEEADKSSIVNEESIYFTGGDDLNSFKAYADEPLIIKNPKLGYTIYFQLVEFGFEDRSKITYFLGYTRYVEMGDKKKWIKARRDCYYGSTLHFYRSLVANTAEREGYEISLRRKMQMNGKAMYQVLPFAFADHVKIDSTKANSFVLSSDLDINVQYNRQPAGKAYLSRHMMIQGNMPRGFQAGIHLLQPLIYIDHYGVVEDPLSVQHSGYWMYEKAANMLPFNYSPD